MKGSPWIRFILVILGFALLANPVWRLTRTRRGGLAPVSLAVRVTEARQQQLMVHLSFATRPQEFVLSHLDKVILEGGGSGTEFEGKLDLILPKEGADLLLKVKWPRGTPRSAVQVRVVNGESPILDQTLWSDKDLVELVTVRGK